MPAVRLRARLLPRLRHLHVLFFNDTATTEIYTLSLHDALPIYHLLTQPMADRARACRSIEGEVFRSEEHTSELQSPCNLVCRLLLENSKIFRMGRRVLSIARPCDDEVAVRSRY